MLTYVLTCVLTCVMRRYSVVTLAAFSVPPPHNQRRHYNTANTHQRNLSIELTEISTMGEPEEKIDADVQLKTIAAEVDRLLKRNGSIDESVAKGVRRSWDGLDQAKVTDTETYEATKAALEKLRDAVHRQVEKRDQSYSRLTGDIEKLEQAVKDGNLKTALSLEQSSTERLKQLDGLSDQRRDTASEKLVALGPEIKKLKQWRHWGTTQARESLIAEMEGLIGAKHLEKLGQDWRHLTKSALG